MKTIIQRVEALVNVLSDDVNDYPDSAAYRMVRDKCDEVMEAIHRPRKKIEVVLGEGDVLIQHAEDTAILTYKDLEIHIKVNGDEGAETLMYALYEAEHSKI